MIELSKAKTKVYATLQQKKFRYQHRLFVIEGEKMVSEALKSGWKIEAIIVTKDQKEFPIPETVQPENIFVADSINFNRISSQKNPEGILAVMPFPDAPHFGMYDAASKLPEPLPAKAFLLEGLQDPGNLGTLMRIADWFGFQALLCNEKTVDIWNPKTLRASMGSVFRVQIGYINGFETWLSDLATTHLVFAGGMKGKPIQESQISKAQFILLGNEGNGLSESTSALPNLKIVTIPGLGQAESLNVSVAAGILAYESTRN